MASLLTAKDIRLVLYEPLPTMNSICERAFTTLDLRSLSRETKGHLEFCRSDPAKIVIAVLYTVGTFYNLLLNTVCDSSMGLSALAIMSLTKDFWKLVESHVGKSRSDFERVWNFFPSDFEISEKNFENF